MFAKENFLMDDLIRILQIDDDATYFDVTRDVLGSDIHLETAASYEQGMALLKSRNFDLALVNMNLIPKKDILSEERTDRLGGEILIFIRDNLPNLPRIAVTGTKLEGSVFGEYLDKYKVTDLIRKDEFKGYNFRDAIYRALRTNKIKVSVRLQHARFSRYLAHYYQKDALDGLPKLQLLEVQIENPRQEDADITILFARQPPYIQETMHTIRVSPGLSKVFLSPVFTDEIKENTVIAINLVVSEKGNLLWKPENSMLIDVVETIPLVLKYVATGDQWMHFLIAACVTPHSEEITKLAGSIRKLWGSEHPDEKWNASRYTNKNVIDILRILRDLLSDLLVLEGTYIPSIPTGLEAVEHVMRLPDEILRSRGANCLYYSLLYASVMENLGINPVLLFLPGHVIPGWKKSSSSTIDIRQIAEPVTRDIINDECVFFESTGTSSKELTFDQLLESGKRISADAQILSLREIPVPVSIVDISGLRKIGLHPFNG